MQKYAFLLPVIYNQTIHSILSIYKENFRNPYQLAINCIIRYFRQKRLYTYSAKSPIDWNYLLHTLKYLRYTKLFLCHCVIFSKVDRKIRSIRRFSSLRWASIWPTRYCTRLISHFDLLERERERERKGERERERGVCVCACIYKKIKNY